jgi:hypothetical protein
MENQTKYRNLQIIITFDFSSLLAIENLQNHFTFGIFDF